MTLSLQTINYPFWLEELVVPFTQAFSTDQDLSGCTATLKVRPSLDSATVIVTLVSPTDITLGGTTGSFSVTWTSAHVSSLISAGITTTNPAVYDMVVTPPSGAPQIPITGQIAPHRNVSR